MKELGRRIHQETEEEDSPRDWGGGGDGNKLPYVASVHGHSEGKCGCSVGVFGAMHAPMTDICLPFCFACFVVMFSQLNICISVCVLLYIYIIYIYLFIYLFVCLFVYLLIYYTLNSCSLSSVY